MALKVLRTVPSFLPYMTGPAKQAHRISYELEKRGISSPIITSDFCATTSKREERLKGVYVRRLHNFGGYMQYLFVPGAVPTLLKEDCDILHAHSYRNFITDAAFLSSKIRGKYFVLHGHGNLLGYKRFLKFKAPYMFYNILTFKAVAKKADALIVSTTQELDECIEFGVEKKKIHIIPVGIDVGKYDKISTRKDPKIKRILFVGRISRDRNIEQILQGFKKVLEDNQEVELLIVGGEARRSFADKGGYLLELKNLAKGLGISKRVQFLGPLYGEDLIKVYKSADIFVNTSLYENLGHVILEAAASSLPILSTPVGVGKDIVENNKTGYLIGYDPKDLYSRLKVLLNDRNISKSLGKNAHNLVEKNYNWTNIIDKYVELYQDL